MFNNLIFQSFPLKFSDLGPVFHWWYGFLERLVAARQLHPRLALLVKIAIDRLALTPPFLLFTLAFIQYLQVRVGKRDAGRYKFIYKI